MKALVLAAGMGSRIRSLAGDLPKPLLEIGARPLLVHNLDWLGKAGVDPVWINLHYGAELIRAAIAKADLDLDIRFSFEAELKGTAGALANIPDLHDERCIVVYGDNLIKLDFATMLAQHLKTGAKATVAVFDQARHIHTGIAGGRVEVLPDHRIHGFVEGGDGTSGYVNAGVYILEPEISRSIPTTGSIDFGKDVFPALLNAGQGLYAYQIGDDGYCLGLDTPESFAVGQALVSQGRVAVIS